VRDEADAHGRRPRVRVIGFRTPSGLSPVGSRATQSAAMAVLASLEWRGDTVGVRGDIDRTNAEALYDTVVTDGANAVDLRGVDFIDSSGIRVLLRLEREGCRLLNLSPFVARVIAVVTGEPLAPPRSVARSRSVDHGSSGAGVPLHVIHDERRSGA
jgi:anti-anti-sigma factor